MSRCTFKMIGLLALGLSFLGTGMSGLSAAQQFFKSADYKFQVVTVASGLTAPWSLAFLPDGRMLVTEKPGRLRFVGKNGKLSAPITGVPHVAYVGQGGLLDVLVDPDFTQSKTIFLSYSEKGRGGQGLAVARARLEGGRLTHVKVLFRQRPKSGGGVHFGGRLVLDNAGFLFITAGERGERKRAQDPSVHRGQIIRIHKDGRIPKDNPFVQELGEKRKGGTRQTWSFGHRNPQGAALHPKTGRLWVHEHGARGGDEVNIPKAGRNYGWPIIAYGRHYSGAKIGVGTHKAGMEQPVHYWDPSIAPSGMAFYTGDKFPKWHGSLFVGALKFRLLSRLTLAGDKVVGEERLLKKLGYRIRDVRQGPDGYLYLLTDTFSGKILRLEPAG